MRSRAIAVSLLVSSASIVGQVNTNGLDQTLEAIRSGEQSKRENRALLVLEAESKERLRQERIRTELLRMELRRANPESYKEITMAERAAAIAEVKARHRDFSKYEARIMALTEELVVPLGGACTPARYFEYLYAIAKAMRR